MRIGTEGGRGCKESRTAHLTAHAQFRRGGDLDLDTCRLTKPGSTCIFLICECVTRVRYLPLLLVNGVSVVLYQKHIRDRDRVKVVYKVW